MIAYQTAKKGKRPAQLTHSEYLLMQAQSIAHFGSWEQSFTENKSDWSEELCNIFGISPANNLHTLRSWLHFIHADDMGYVISTIRKGRDTFNKSSLHCRIVRTDGCIRHIHSQVEFEFDKDGITVGLHGVAHDITETKEAEAERTKMINDLVQRNKDLEQFSYIISHNLRAPVANILGIVSVLQNVGLDKKEEIKATSYLETAARNLDTVIKDINSILELKQRVNEKREIVKFADILSEIKTSFDTAITDELIQINGNFSAAKGMIALKSYVHSIFYNLISNSIKYRRQDVKPVIEIRSQMVNDKIQLTFQDNGMGINLEQNRDNVFGLYKRFHSHVEGKGMGLYMVKTQVASLGGTIDVTSEVNKGTTFNIVFSAD